MLPGIRKIGLNMTVEDSTYTPSEAARILKLSRRRVQQLLDSKELEGYKDASGRWMAYQWSVHQLLSDRPAKNDKAKEPEDWPPEALDALTEAKDLRYQLGRVEGRLELEAIARSTLEQQLKREQERADQERERAEQERQDRLTAQEEARQLRERLEQRNLPWYKRWFS